MRIESNRVVFVIAAVLLASMTPMAVWADKPATEPAAPASGVRAEFLADFAAVTGKVLQLAEAIPAEKYTWRPQAGVRSVSEVLLHAAGANYFMPTFFGGTVPEGIDLKTFETSTTDKAKVIEALRSAIAHGRAQALRLSDADLEKTGKWFGGTQVTYRAMLVGMAEHCHEHLGQLIAYARMNGVTPPWSKTD